MVTLTEGKRHHIQRLANESGVIAALAMDQRGSLAKSIAALKGAEKSQVTSAMMEEFKTTVSEVLSPHASALLLDPEYGLPAASARAPDCGLLLAYEASGYDNTRPGRLPDLLDAVSVRRIKEWGGNAVKLLVYYTPFEDPMVNDIKHAFVERAGAECAAEDLAFFLEFVGYDPAGGDEKSIEYAKRKPEIVAASMAEFSKPQYRVDVLKVEFPVNPRFVEGSRAFSGERAYTRAEALKLFKRASDVATLPFIYLSAGVDNDVFIEQLEMAAEAGSDFSGVLCGRATWKEGIPVYAQRGVGALREWLSTSGVANIGRINAALGAAKPCWGRLKA
jgi:tagatose 1,6-diphosphate aldolase